jgi:hypothetical protein
MFLKFIFTWKYTWNEIEKTFKGFPLRLTILMMHLLLSNTEYAEDRVQHVY